MFVSQVDAHSRFPRVRTAACAKPPPARRATFACVAPTPTARACTLISCASMVRRGVGWRAIMAQEQNISEIFSFIYDYRYLCRQFSISDIFHFVHKKYVNHTIFAPIFSSSLSRGRVPDHAPVQHVRSRRRAGQRQSVCEWSCSHRSLPVRGVFSCMIFVLPSLPLLVINSSLSIESRLILSISFS
jgi:hypothetical protein